MEEARYSFNFKFVLNGFESQFTLRSDESWMDCLAQASRATTQLHVHGAVPTVHRGGGQGPSVHSRGGNGGNGHQVTTCPTCRKVDRLELIEWSRDGKDMHAWKCQRCEKWMPRNFEPPKQPALAAAPVDHAKAQKDIEELWD